MQLTGVKLQDTGVGKLLLLLVVACLLSMAGVAVFYHLALGRVVKATAESSAETTNDFRSSYTLIETLTRTQNSLQRLLREKDPDVLEKLVNELDVRKKDMAIQIDALGEEGQAVQAQFISWTAACDHIVETFLRGENAEANSELVNNLMPELEKVLHEIRQVNEGNERDAAQRAQVLDAQILHIRYAAVTGVAIAGAVVAAGGLALRRQVSKGTGAIAETLGRLTSLRAANEALEERVRERTTQIERNHAQMAAIHQTSLDSVLVLDSQWRIIEFNPSAARTFHCAAEEALGKKLSDFIVPPGAKDAAAFVTTGEASILGKLIEVQAKSSQGSFPAEMAVTAAALDGPPLYIVSLRDLTERKKAETERDELNHRLLTASRHAGMAEVATGVLHNVGNVLNSVNVSATVVADKLRHSEIASLIKVGEMIGAHKQDIAAFLTTDEQGKLVPEFIGELAQLLGEEQRALLTELNTLAQGVDHIKQIVSAQQTLVKKSAVLTPAQPAKLVETALTMQSGALRGDGIEIVRDFVEIDNVPLDQHRIVQILVNLIGNAKQAVKAGDHQLKRITLSSLLVDAEEGQRVRFTVTDTGVGIAPQNLTRIFSHGFTTKKEGHGFGLHSSANAAKEMGGTLTAASDGPGKGATFTLEIPLVPNSKGELCKS